MADLKELLDQINALTGSTRDLGGAAGPDDAKAIAKLILGGGSASLEGMPLFGGGVSPRSSQVANPAIPEGIDLNSLGEPRQVPAIFGRSMNAAGQIPNDSAPVQSIPQATPAKAPISSAFQKVLDTADQIATSLSGGGAGTSMRTLLPNPYGPGSYDPTDPVAVAAVKAAGAAAAKRQADVDTARSMMQQLERSTDPLTKKAAPELQKSILQSIGIGQTPEQIAEAKARGTAKGKGTFVSPEEHKANLDTMAGMVANNDLNSVSAMNRFSTQERAYVYAQALKINPNWSQKDYTTQMNMARDASTGNIGKNVRSINTAIGHASTLMDAVDALGNDQNQWSNWMKNKAAEITGDTRNTSYDTAKTAVAAEMAALLKNSGTATDQEIEKWSERFKNAQSPAQHELSIKTVIELLGSRLETLDEQYKSVNGGHRDMAFLYDKQAGQLEKMGFHDLAQKMKLTSKGKRLTAEEPGVDRRGAAPAKTAAPSGAIAVYDKNGTPGWVPAGSSDEDIKKEGYRRR